MNLTEKEAILSKRVDKLIGSSEFKSADVVQKSFLIQDLRINFDEQYQEKEVKT